MVDAAPQMPTTLPTKDPVGLVPCPHEKRPHLVREQRAVCRAELKQDDLCGAPGEIKEQGRGECRHVCFCMCA
jgi:hypothetical protein